MKTWAERFLDDLAAQREARKVPQKKRRGRPPKPKPTDGTLTLGGVKERRDDSSAD